MGHPILVNGDRINLIQVSFYFFNTVNLKHDYEKNFILKPIWCEDTKNVTEEQHNEFYQFLGNFDKPRYTLHFKTDSPINIRSIFYVPTFKPGMELLLFF